MRCTPIVTGLVLSSIVFATPSAQAQVTLDVSKINCDQWVHAKLPTLSEGSQETLLTRANRQRDLVAAWLSGYYNAKRNKTIINLDTFEDSVSKVQNYCYDEKNFKVPIMKAVERVLGNPSNAR